MLKCASKRRQFYAFSVLIFASFFYQKVLALDLKGLEQALRNLKGEEARQSGVIGLRNGLQKTAEVLGKLKNALEELKKKISEVKEVKPEEDFINFINGIKTKKFGKKINEIAQKLNKCINLDVHAMSNFIEKINEEIKTEVRESFVEVLFTILERSDATFTQELKTFIKELTPKLHQTAKNFLRLVRLSENFEVKDCKNILLNFLNWDGYKGDKEKEDSQSPQNFLDDLAQYGLQEDQFGHSKLGLSDLINLHKVTGQVIASFPSEENNWDQYYTKQFFLLVQKSIGESLKTIDDLVKFSEVKTLHLDESIVISAINEIIAEEKLFKIGEEKPILDLSDFKTAQEFHKICVTQSKKGSEISYVVLFEKLQKLSSLFKGLNAQDESLKTFIDNFNTIVAPYEEGKKRILALETYLKENKEEGIEQILVNLYEYAQEELKKKNPVISVKDYLSERIRNGYVSYDKLQKIIEEAQARLLSDMSESEAVLLYAFLEDLIEKPIEIKNLTDLLDLLKKRTPVDEKMLISKEPKYKNFLNNLFQGVQKGYKRGEVAKAIDYSFSKLPQENFSYSNLVKTLNVMREEGGVLQGYLTELCDWLDLLKKVRSKIIEDEALIARRKKIERQYVLLNDLVGDPTSEKKLKLVEQCLEEDDELKRLQKGAAEYILLWGDKKAVLDQLPNLIKLGDMKSYYENQLDAIVKIDTYDAAKELVVEWDNSQEDKEWKKYEMQKYEEQTLLLFLQMILKENSWTDETYSDYQDMLKSFFCGNSEENIEKVPARFFAGLISVDLVTSKQIYEICDILAANEEDGGFKNFLLEVVNLLTSEEQRASLYEIKQEVETTKSTYDDSLLDEKAKKQVEVLKKALRKKIQDVDSKNFDVLEREGVVDQLEKDIFVEQENKSLSGLRFTKESIKFDQKIAILIENFRDVFKGFDAKFLAKTTFATTEEGGEVKQQKIKLAGKIQAVLVSIPDDTQDVYFDYFRSSVPSGFESIIKKISFSSASSASKEKNFLVKINSATSKPPIFHVEQYSEKFIENVTEAVAGLSQAQVDSAVQQISNQIDQEAIKVQEEIKTMQEKLVECEAFLRKLAQKTFDVKPQLMKTTGDLKRHANMIERSLKELKAVTKKLEEKAEIAIETMLKRKSLVELLKAQVNASQVLLERITELVKSMESIVIVKQVLDDKAAEEKQQKEEKVKKAKEVEIKKEQEENEKIINMLKTEDPSKVAEELKKPENLEIFFRAIDAFDRNQIKNLADKKTLKQAIKGIKIMMSYGEQETIQQYLQIAQDFDEEKIRKAFTTNIGDLKTDNIKQYVTRKFLVIKVLADMGIVQLTELLRKKYILSSVNFNGETFYDYVNKLKLEKEKK